MGRNKFNYSHADVGSEPSNALDFQKGERPKAGHFDWFWYSVIQAINAHADEFDRLDTDDDGTVDEADEVDGWDKADIQNWVNNSSDVPNADSANNADQLDGMDYTDIQNWVNNNADVPNADHADNADTADQAGNADSLGNVAASGYTRTKAGVQAPVYQTKSDVPSGISEGEFVYISGEGLYVEDGT